MNESANTGGKRSLASRAEMLRRAVALARVGIFEGWAPFEASDLIWSDEMFEIMGRDPSLGPRSLAETMEAMLPDDLRKLQEAVAANEGEPIEGIYRVRRGEGEIRHLRMRLEVELDEEGEVVRRFGTLVDITEQVRTQEQLRETLADLQLTNDLLVHTQRVAKIGTGVGNLPLNPESHYWSDEVYRIFGRDPELGPMDAETFLAMVHPQDVERVGNAVAELASGARASLDMEYRMFRDGSLRHIRSLVDTMQDDSKAARSFAVLQDITDLRQLEQELHQAQKLEAVGTLARGIAHDYNNLLMSVTGCIDMAKNTLEQDHDARFFLDQAVGAAKRGALLTEQLLTFGRRQEVHARDIRFDDGIARSTTMIRALLGRGIELRLDLGANDWYVHIDPTQLDQVLLNLAANARDAMAGEGVFTIETSGDDEHVRLVVTDTGSGMDPDTSERIFEPFFTTKEPGHGTGLGLSTVYGIVKRFGGDIHVESRPGKGTTFTLQFPRAPDDAHSVPSRRPDGRSPGA